jgi:hypothetical protein
MPARTSSVVRSGPESGRASVISDDAAMHVVLVRWLEVGWHECAVRSYQTPLRVVGVMRVAPQVSLRVACESFARKAVGHVKERAVRSVEKDHA